MRSLRTREPLSRESADQLADFLEARVREQRERGGAAGRTRADAELQLIGFLRPEPVTPPGDGLYVAVRSLQILARAYDDHPDYREEWRG